jgi:hypothetical protein
LLAIATIRSGIIVFMKNAQKTRIEASQAATTIHISHLGGEGQSSAAF